MKNKKLCILGSVLLYFNFSLLGQVNLKPLSFVSFKNSSTYIIGQDVQSYPASRSVSPFSINKYETTYGLWFNTRQKAEKLGYVFSNKGMPGSFGKVGSLPDEYTSVQPVTMINWYDAIVWCNALSEIKGLTPCYTYKGKVLKDATSAVCDLAVCNWNCDGYRLPSEAEWEYASRRTKSGMQKGNLVSGQIDSEGRSYEERDYSEVCWDLLNTYETKPVGIAGTVFTPDSIPECGSGNPNGAGIFDMSGNVLEFVWDWAGTYNQATSNYGPDFGEKRVSRGGSFSEYTPFLFCGDRYFFDPNEAYNYMGFRICRSLIN
ncbi:MAG: SUMF1/EgtB/PvdO family nonheme iron enzyme [Treponema sp.]|nr:SUMF1/EgtB/PvdO family nonheme iron enzyme [Treponema sp.]